MVNINVYKLNLIKFKIRIKSGNPIEKGKTYRFHYESKLNIEKYQLKSFNFNIKTTESRQYSTFMSYETFSLCLNSFVILGRFIFGIGHGENLMACPSMTSPEVMDDYLIEFYLNKFS